MDGGVTGNAVPSNSVDKSRVWDVKPLRTLKPVFRDASNGPSNGPPFVSTPPNGPFPTAFSPFFPFNGPQGSPSTPGVNPNTVNSTAVPIRSFREEPPRPTPAASNGENVDRGSKRKSAGPSSAQKRVKSNLAELALAAVTNFKPGISLAEKDDGNREIVESVLSRFDALRRKLSQMEDAQEAHCEVLKRANLKAGNIMFTKGVRTNGRRRIGVVPGVEIGDIFFFRMEMILVGIHAQSMAGIDAMPLKGDLEKEKVAVSIVSSGGYDDDAEDPDILIYTGQGGNASADKEASDQKLVRGNLALEKSLHRGIEVRVIRGFKDPIIQTCKVYVYDGLYKVQESWMEKGKSGCNTFKYKLARLPGQADAYATWKSIQKWKADPSSRDGVILPDLTSGAESTPVSLVNEVDDEKGPSHFTYVSTVKYPKTSKLVQPSVRCNCPDVCKPANSNCSCNQKNGGEFPYISNGILVCRRPMIHECGSSCPCTRNCKNRVIQTGFKVHLEVFKTRDKGWGLRSWDPIRAGTYICEYAGEVLEDGEDNVENNDYVFNTNRVFQSFKWSHETDEAGEEGSDTTGAFDIPSPLIISSKNCGNVARFINHSCSPNIFWQPIMYEQNNEAFPHIAFFAKRHIPPLTELTFDYGTPRTEETGSNNADNGRKKCLCGSPKCRGYFY